MIEQSSFLIAILSLSDGSKALLVLPLNCILFCTATGPGKKISTFGVVSSLF